MTGGEETHNFSQEPYLSRALEISLSIAWFPHLFRIMTGTFSLALVFLSLEHSFLVYLTMKAFFFALKHLKIPTQ